MNSMIIKMLENSNKEDIVMIDYVTEKVYSVTEDRLSIWRSRNSGRVTRSRYYTKEYYEKIKTHIVNELAEDQQYAFERGAEDNDCRNAVIENWEDEVRKITMTLEGDPNIILNGISYYRI